MFPMGSENLPIWMMNLPPGSVHQGAHKTLVITPNPHDYNVTAFGTTLPHVFGGGNGGGGMVPNQVESETGDGVSSTYTPLAQKVFVNPYENPATGEGADAVIEQEVLSKEAVDAAMAQSNDVNDRMVTLGQITNSKTPGPAGRPYDPKEHEAVLRASGVPDVAPNPDYIFEQMLRQPAPAPSAPTWNMPNYGPQQPGIPDALASYIRQQMQEMQRQTSWPTERPSRAPGFREPPKPPAVALEQSDSKPGDYAHIGLPWVKDPPEAPKVTVIFSFGRMTHKAKFHNVSVRQCGTHKCLYLGIDERYEGAMTFPDPSGDPFRVTVPDKDIDLIVYDADIRLDCGGKLTFIVLLEAGEEEYDG